MNWYDTLTDDQIHWLKTNRVPWWLLSPDEKSLFDGIPNSELLVSAGLGGFNPVDKFPRSNGVYQLRCDWKRPQKTRIHDILPVRKGRRWRVNYPLWFGGWDWLDSVHGRSDWLWTKWEWRDPANERDHVWYEFPGGLSDGDTPRDYQSMRNSTVPPKPVAVRLVEDVPNE